MKYFRKSWFSEEMGAVRKLSLQAPQIAGNFSLNSFQKCLLWHQNIEILIAFHGSPEQQVQHVD